MRVFSLENSSVLAPNLSEIMLKYQSKNWEKNMTFLSRINGKESDFEKVKPAVLRSAIKTMKVAPLVGKT